MIFASLDSLIPTDLERESRVHPSKLPRAHPIPAGPGLTLAAPSTLNFNLPTQEGGHSTSFFPKTEPLQKSPYH